MDSGSSTHENDPVKRQKENNEGEDRISKLPDCIISRTTKEAVRTSVLSKEWINNWRSITSLHLDDIDMVYGRTKHIEHECFERFMYRSLLLTNSRLDNFSLSIHDHHDMFNLNEWIYGALRKFPKKLCIKSQRKLSFAFSTAHSLFTSQSLQELEIYMSYCYANITVPRSRVHLGQLKFLTLHEVKFSCSDKDPELSLPLLQKIKTVNCIWLGVRCVTFNVPLLETIDITQHTNSSWLEGNCKIKFRALHLKEFCLCDYGYLSSYLTMIDPSSAQNASATLILPPYERGVSSTVEHGALELLKQFSQVRYLKFGGPDVLAQEVILLPEFGMLRHLELDSVTGEFLLALLLKTPILNTLVVERLKSEYYKALLKSAVVPDCLRHTLQVVNFRDVCGDKHELHFAKFFMEKGSVLKRMSFSLSHLFVKSEAIEELEQKLSGLKKCLTSTIVEVLKEDYYNSW
ncbi:F-box/FBD/LRR-repeat protein At3g14710-like isoform X2 [Arachis stenosperma]|nr:F-box/FBD/LRR-repeat protein At3g14710-like isoform X2 [Arachis stenosperma]